MPELRPQRHAVRSPARRRLIASGAGTLALSLAPWQLAYGASLLGVRVWPAPSYTRVAIEHDQPQGGQLRG